ncbi:hypothetical protein PAPYR_9849 [Paratrimastix pyriformis]|uniref:Uncharacterized protein n=1 Tax=Paratrimastix pyriformis TaxID=342808 RepID=A0ABQ8UCZ0_9EUKA|nr:hypothetical protein PAPYR_9849 [Paratrimastix pyriformis]
MVFTLSWFGFVWGYPTRLSLVLRTREGEWWDSRVISPKQTQTKTSLPPTSLPDEWHWPDNLIDKSGGLPRGEASVAVVQPYRRLHGKGASTASPAPVGDW